jgi:hypothetical protein
MTTLARKRRTCSEPNYNSGSDRTESKPVGCRRSPSRGGEAPYDERIGERVSEARSEYGGSR